MIKSNDRCGRASVTFTLPAAVRATRVAVCGEWNGWSAERDVMDRVGDVFSLTIVLPQGRLLSLWTAITSRNIATMRAGSGSVC